MVMNQRAKLFIPLGVFLFLSIFFYRGLFLDPTEIPSVLVNKSFPEFSLPNLDDENSLLTKENVVGEEYTLVNVWASWCVSCKVEHSFLVNLADKGVNIVGVNWKDDTDAARQTLINTGNPYAKNIVDKEGRLTFDLGVTGSPETYLVNPEGIIVYKHVGVLDLRIWEEKMLPLMSAI